MRWIMFIVFLTVFDYEFNSAQGVCPANEEPSECGANGCQNTCASPDLSTRCRGVCIAGCVCIEGYLRDSNGQCVPPNQCEYCNAFEVFTQCNNHPCQNTCAEPNLITRCSYVPGCYSGCICLPGYLRDQNRKCVPENQCPVIQSCGTNEVYSNSGKTICENTCAEPTKMTYCKAPSYPGCGCIEGYLRNLQGQCVHPQNCVRCKKFQVYSKCDNHPCRNTCEQPDLASRCRYIPGCYPGCICIPGYLKDQAGRCIPQRICTAKRIENFIGKLFHQKNANTPCSPNEVYSQTGKWICENTCKEPTKRTYCKARAYPGCGCIEGYLRNEQGQCVFPRDCVVCKEFEEYSKCGNHPCQNTCAEQDLITRCTYEAKCYPGCICQPGYLRDENQRCILKKDCPNKQRCGPNEVFACGSACDTTCETLGQVCPIVNIKCNDMCYCIDGYARDASNICIPIEECPPKQCPINETLNPCPFDCPPEETCASYISGVAVLCAAPPEPRVCKPKCECLSGFVRKNVGGKCVDPKNCCDDPNAEVVSCPNPCPGGTCESPRFAPCKAPCKIRGCQCKPGYVKNSKGRCILESLCHKPKKCPKNEVWNPCSKEPDLVCPTHSRHSKSYNQDFPNQDCVARCECKKGYVRIHGKCKMSSKCCKDPHAELVKCPNPCPGGTCEQPKFTHCPAMCLEVGCQCKKGYLKNKKGKCIHRNRCPHTKCKKNEKWNPCPGYCTFDQTCPMLLDGVIIDCARPPPNPPCAPRCECLEGLVRINGSCVEPSCCCEGNTTLVECPNPCYGGTCEQPNIIPCNNICKKLGCECKPGYVRNSEDKCILRDDCPIPQCGMNEVWNPCPRYCSFDQTCEGILDGIVLECAPPPPNVRCVARCTCQPGFVRINGACLEPSQCCSANSELVNCPTPCPETCDGPPFPNCIQECLRKGCVCRSGYVKNNDGECILRSDCPTPSCGENEVLNPCPGLCSPTGSCDELLYGFLSRCLPPLNESISFSGDCKPRCDCKEGFARINGTCQNASLCCGANADIRDCPLPCPDTCEGRFPPDCIQNCVRKGCVCRPGFVKNNQGECILLSDCPLSCGENEVLNPCVAPCSPTGSCDELLYGFFPRCLPPLNSPLAFSGNCVQRCDCKEGFSRINGTCQDSSLCCGANADVVPCPVPCQESCKGPPPPACLQQCLRHGCVCRPGYVKSNEGNCILKADCPKSQCGLNEVWNTCPSYCSFDKTCEELLEGIRQDCAPPPPNPPCIPRCECLPGFVRINGTCLEPSQCCGANTELVDCPIPCQEICFGPVPPPDCVQECSFKECICQPGYVKDYKGDCVLKINCTHIQQNCGPNEIWSPYPRYCTFDKTCEELLYGHIRDCAMPPPNPPCEPRCECEPGLVRINGQCLEPSACCLSNQHLVDCPYPCPDTCDFTAPPGCMIECSGKKCACLPGYVEYMFGHCVQHFNCHSGTTPARMTPSPP